MEDIRVFVLKWDSCYGAESENFAFKEVSVIVNISVTTQSPDSIFAWWPFCSMKSTKVFHIFFLNPFLVRLVVSFTATLCKAGALDLLPWLSCC